MAKDPPASAGDGRHGVQSLGQEGPLEEEMAAPSSMLAWRAPARRSLVAYSPRDCKEPYTAERTRAHTHTGFMAASEGEVQGAL